MKKLFAILVACTLLFSFSSLALAEGAQGKNVSLLTAYLSSVTTNQMIEYMKAGLEAQGVNVTVVDTKTLSVPAGWQVEIAARAAKAGWPLEKILDAVKRVGDSTEVIYTLNELKYLIHGGRISHMKGLLASVLNIKPLIGVEKVRGTYVTNGQARSFGNAIKGLAEYVTRKANAANTYRVQVVHASNPDAAQTLLDEVTARLKCEVVPTRNMSLVLGAHVGRSMIGVAFAPAEAFADLP